MVMRPAQSTRLAMKIEAEFLQRGSVHFGEPHLQHHLLALVAARQLQHVDDLELARAGAGDLGGAQHDRIARHTARQDQGLVVHRHANVFTGEQRLQLLLEHQHAGVDDDVILHAACHRPRESG